MHMMEVCGQWHVMVAAGPADVAAAAADVGGLLVNAVGI